MNDFLYNRPEIMAPATCSSSKGLVVNSECKNDEEPGPSSRSATSSVTSSVGRKRNHREELIQTRHNEKLSKIDKLQGSINDLINIIKIKKEPEA